MTWLGILACIATSSFFAGLETGLVSANQFTLYAKKEKGILHARAADFLLLKPERLLSTTLIGTNISVVTATTLLTSLLRGSGPPWAPAVGSVVLAVTMLVFAEVVPKSFFRQNADTIAVRLAPVLLVFYALFYPAAVVLNLVVKFILAITGQLRTVDESLSSRQSLRTLVRLSSREAGIPLADQRIVEDIFDFQETLAREVMVQIHRTLACPVSLPIAEIVDRAAAWEVRYVPIYEHRIDNVIGYLDVEELAAAEVLTVEATLRPPVFFPETKPIPDLLLEMNSQSLRVVFLSNEYGRITGIITPLEIVGEIIGRRPDGASHQKIQLVADDTYRVSGLADVEDVQHVTGVAIPKGPYDTIGGYLLTRFGRIPGNGESIAIDRTTFTVTDRDELRIKQLEMRPATQTTIQPTTRTSIQTTRE